MDTHHNRYFHAIDGWTADAGSPLYAGLVTPSVHYTMGGVTIDPFAHVLRHDGSGNDGGAMVKGLYAAGEVRSFDAACTLSTLDRTYDRASGVFSRSIAFVSASSRS